MSSTARRLALGALVTVLAVALVSWRPAPFRWLDLKAFDLLSARLPPETPFSRIAIVDIDEKSLATHGRWPWRRDLLAQLTVSIRRAGASLIVFDMVFSEPDDGANASGVSNRDLALASALAEGPTVAGYYFSFDAPAPMPQDCDPPAVPLVFRSGRRLPDPAMFVARSVLCSIPPLARPLAASGFLNAAPDSDGILRRIPLVVRYGERTFPSLALAAMLKTSPAEPLFMEHGLWGNVLHAGRTRIPVDDRGAMLLRFHGPAGAFPHFPAADVLSGAVGPEWLEGKTVLIGSSAPGLREYSITPVDTFHPGVDVQAAALDNLYHGDFLYRSIGGWFWEKAIAVLLGFTTTALVFSGSGVWRLTVATSQGVLLWFAVWSSLSRDGAYFSPIPASFTLCCVAAAFAVHYASAARMQAAESTRKLALARKFTASALAAVMEVRDAETGAHLIRTQSYTRILCRALTGHPRFRPFLTADTIEMLVQLAPIHDIGKIGVPDHILRKPGPLTLEEYSFVRRHVEFGRDVIERASRRAGVADPELLDLALDIIYAHHEHWNGDGYPRGLRGEEIPIAGRLLAVVDMYDALVSRRVYKESYPHEEAKRMIEAASGTQFDPDVVDAFVLTELDWLRVAREFTGDSVG